MTPTTTEWRAPFHLAGGSLELTIRRSPRARLLRLTIDPRHDAVVTVPTRVARSKAEAERVAAIFVAEREKWLRRHLDGQARQRARVVAMGPLQDGGMFRFRGEPHCIRILAAEPRHRTSVTREGGDARRRTGGPAVRQRETHSGGRPGGLAPRPRPDGDRARHRAPRYGVGRSAVGHNDPRWADAVGELLPFRPPLVLVAALAGAAGGARDGRDPRARASPRLWPRSRILGHRRHTTARPSPVAALAAGALAGAAFGAGRRGRAGVPAAAVDR